MRSKDTCKYIVFDRTKHKITDNVYDIIDAAQFVACKLAKQHPGNEIIICKFVESYNMTDWLLTYYHDES